MKYIAVLITVFNRKEKTLLCLKNLYKQVVPEDYALDVWLTNDGCTDGTPEAVREQFPQVHVVDGDGNLFWNRGMHKAWEAAAAHKNYDYYLWLNDDTFLYVGAITNLLDASVGKADNAIIVGCTQDTDRSKVTYGGRNKDGKIPTPNGSLEEVSYFNGNIVLVPNVVYKQLGNLDYYFTHSKGDFDYGLRATKKGIKIYQTGKILGECDTHLTIDKWCNPDVPLKQRWKMLHRPNGMPPTETFHLEKRHKGLLLATYHYITIYLRCLSPKIWRIK